ncbi:MAG TPA: hypothetical protein VHK01_20510 [Lacipirellulaceae bacterium]|nr:hypothetical protein [Lacipirellulaceae bacterium]
MKVSGKLVIVAILMIAFAAAGASWWFRYSATNQAARYWGPEGSLLIRDARNVYLQRSPPETGPQVNISQARGITHLRNALLEDRSFNWASKTIGETELEWVLTFFEPGTDLMHIGIADDCRVIGGYTLGVNRVQVMQPVSCEPIANGLRELFMELEADSPRAAR